MGMYNFVFVALSVSVTALFIDLEGSGPSEKGQQWIVGKYNLCLYFCLYLYLFFCLYFYRYLHFYQVSSDLEGCGRSANGQQSTASTINIL